MVIPEGSREDLCKVVSEADSGGWVLCQFKGGGTHRFHVDDLEPYDAEAEAQAKKLAQEQLDKATYLFEAAFEQLQQARATAEKANLFLGQYYFDVKKLDELVEKNGWSSSSIWC